MKQTIIDKPIFSRIVCIEISALIGAVACLVAPLISGSIGVFLSSILPFLFVFIYICSTSIRVVLQKSKHNHSGNKTD